MDCFILAVGANGRYNLPGWILAKDGKVAEFWKDPVGARYQREGVNKPRPAFWVPQRALRPMASLARVDLTPEQRQLAPPNLADLEPDF